MLIGRESEQQTINRLLSGARVGHSGTLLLVGEPGIGKTSLLNHATEHAEGMLVLRAFGSEQEQNVPFAGLHQLLAPVLPTLKRLPAPHGDTLAVALGLREGQVGGRFAVGVAILGLVTHLADQSSLLVAVDDAHLADPGSIRAIASAVARLRGVRLLLLLVRSAESGGDAEVADVLDRLPAGPARDRLSDALDVLRRAGDR